MTLSRDCAIRRCRMTEHAPMLSSSWQRAAEHPIAFRERCLETFDFADPHRECVRKLRAILVADVVESVRLMEQDEDDMIQRWRRFIHIVTSAELPRLRGRLVKSLGDGMLVEFEGVGDSIEAALAMLACLDRINSGAPCNRHIRLRIGIHLAEVVVHDLDIFGVGVNLAARLASIGGPQEIIVSAAVRDQLGEGATVTLDDLGKRRLKHVQKLQHIYRARPIRTRAALTTTAAKSATSGSADLPPLGDSSRPRKWLPMPERWVIASVMRQIELQRARTLTAVEYVRIAIQLLCGLWHREIPLAPIMREVAVGTDKA